jgi:putative ATP-dependent endonuclease of the OLD family
MYISKFSAFNYRSLKQVIIRLENGKNVLVGKNNSGKSNIIRGIEILVGERFPSSQNISDNDFYTFENVDEETGEVSEVISNDFYLEAELAGRDFDETLILSIKKSTAFSKIKDSSILYSLLENSDVKINFDFFQGLDELEQKEGIVAVSTPYGDKKTIWKTSNQLLDFLKNSKIIKLFFCKSRQDDEKAGYGLICVDPSGGIWVSHFLSKKLRDAIITTTVISALRSHKEDLRLVHYTWFGKLILGLWNKNKVKLQPNSSESYEKLLKGKSLDIKNLVDQVFDSDTAAIRKLLQGAIAHKSVSFKFMEDANNELHKNVKLFVNDGIDRPLHEKGTGIQSAIIISLFSLYCDQYHNASSLLITEEPELFLHPQARRVISAELDKFLVSSLKQKRQLIISTHSTEYLKNVEPYNVIRIYKDSLKNCSICAQLSNEVSKQITIELKRFLWSNNSELFFADKVILVEGGEVYLIPAIVDKIQKSSQVLDYKNITVTRVNGKGSFMTYIKMLECFEISYVILGDLDCFKDEVGKFIKHKNLSELKVSVGTVKKAIGSMLVCYGGVAERLENVTKNFDAQLVQELFEKIQNGTLLPNDNQLQLAIELMKAKFVSGNKYDTIIEQLGLAEYQKIHLELRKNKMFVWAKGDLESCYTHEANSFTLGMSKDIKALQLSYLLKAEGNSLEKLFVNAEELNELVKIILAD